MDRCSIVMTWRPLGSLAVCLVALASPSCGGGSDSVAAPEDIVDAAADVRDSSTGSRSDDASTGSDVSVRSDAPEASTDALEASTANSADAFGGSDSPDSSLESDAEGDKSDGSHDAPGGDATDAAPVVDDVASGDVKAGDADSGCVPVAESCNGLDDDCDGVAEQGRWLKDLFAVGTTWDLPIGCLVQSLPGGDVAVADQGQVGCVAESCGHMDGICNAKDVPAHLSAQIVAVQQTLTATDQASIALTFNLTTGAIYFDSVSRTPAECLLMAPVMCSLRFDSARSAPALNTMLVTIRYTVDVAWARLLDLKVVSSEGTKICGSSGAAAPPECLAASDVGTNGENTCGNNNCSSANFDPVKTLVLQLMAPALQNEIQALVESQACEPCGTGLKACPP